MGASSVALFRKEIEDFCTTIRAVGYSEADFSLRYVQWSATTKPKSGMIDLIIVKRQSTGVEKAYAADPMATWLLSFFDDLRSGVFGRNEKFVEKLSEAIAQREPEQRT